MTVRTYRLPRNGHPLVAWALYACVLLNLLACGIHHGQMGGLALNGLGGTFCAEGHDAGAADLSGKHDNSASPAYSCPLCASFSAAVAVNSAGWSLPALSPEPSEPLDHLAWAQPPPRYVWPSLNPRASPADAPVMTHLA
jgi:hypothetical protein